MRTRALKNILETIRDFESFSIKSKFRIIFFAANVAFFLYFLINVTVVLVNKSYLGTIRTRTFPILERIDASLTHAERLKAALSEGILTSDVEKVSQAESLAKKIRADLDQVNELSHSSSKSELDHLKKTFDSFFGSGKTLADSLIAGLTDLTSAKGDITAVNRSYETFYAELNAFRGRAYEQFLSTLSRANATSWVSLVLGISILMACMLGLYRALRYVDRLSDSLSEVSDALADAASRLTSTAKQVQESGESLSSTATEQNQAVMGVVASIQQIQNALNHTANASNAVLKDAKASKEETDHGVKVVQNMTEAMEIIGRANAQLKSVSDIIRQIESKTRVIYDIVFQTKLLSFNASIEAARAGEHGRGFAVVAGEIQKLVETTGRAAADITKLLKESETQVGTAVKDTLEKVGAGQEVSKNCRAVFVKIAQNVQNLSNLVESIDQLARQQTDGISGIGTAMQQIDQAAGRNAKDATSAVGVAGTLLDQASLLESNVGALDRTIRGTREFELPEWIRRIGQGGGGSGGYAERGPAEERSPSEAA